MQKATGISNWASPAMDPSGAKKQTTAERDLEEDERERPERKRTLLRNGSTNINGPTEMESSSIAPSTKNGSARKGSSESQSIWKRIAKSLRATADTAAVDNQSAVSPIIIVFTADTALWLSKAAASSLTQAVVRFTCLSSRRHRMQSALDNQSAVSPIIMYFTADTALWLSRADCIQ
ncbi:hypothetical protein ElyMa_002788600 [Elysia marginata]|uniref:Uncharacterized protein n=1 Tax=Elysia marginata TaxID=1093978 RepID=A0AAV4HR40_9GAST|nr:hypothetical protein ElyMa_002788600 [Elysia marginata]